MRIFIIVFVVLMLALSGCNKKTDNVKPPQSAEQPGNTSTTSPEPTPAASSAPGASIQPAQSAAPAVSATPKPPAGAKDPIVITKKQYDSLDFGLSYEEVGKIVGGLGKLVDQSPNQVVYEFKGDQGGTAKLTFLNGKLNAKSNVDLK